MTINEFLKITGLRHLYHFTDVENIPLIRKYGLLPYSKLLQRGISPPRPGGNDWSRGADTIKGVHRYVHLCLKDQHPMEYVARKKGHIGETKFLQVSVEVLFSPGVMGSDDISNKSGVAIRPIEKVLDTLDLNILFKDKVDFSNPELCHRYIEAKKAEILIPSIIHPHLIINLH